MYKFLAVLILAAIVPYFCTVPRPTTFDSSMANLTSISRNVVKKVLAVETPEGAGALVRRSIGSMTLRNLTPFLMLDHFHVSKGAGFPDHAHRGQATVTMMLDGKVLLFA
ncbi:RNA pol II transcription cofactor [Stygiomarasmius scandens]|uniref:RNA pol II transcription cofactor n=1 Tax=Marasmiellus scandens TaxID=2682957 RepID=A0ABR1JXP7_9AGAR